MAVHWNLTLKYAVDFIDRKYGSRDLFLYISHPMKSPAFIRFGSAKHALQAPEWRVGSDRRCPREVS